MRPSSKTALPTSTWTMGPWPRAALYALFAAAGYMFVRAHFLTTIHFLDLPSYLAGHERLPFQRRILPMLLFNALMHLTPASKQVTRHGIFADPLTMYSFLLDVLSMAAAAYFCVRLHRKAAPRSRWRLLVFPVFLWALVWTFLVHTIFNHYFPYDLLSVAFFSAGLCFIYERRFLPLLFVVLAGALNRETVLFLVPIFLFDAISTSATLRLSIGSLGRAQVPLLKTLILFLAWLCVSFTLSRFYTQNDTSELHLRFRENLHHLSPNNWPQFLGACGFLLPVIWSLRRRIPDSRIAAWLWVLPLWVAVMFARGIVTETRIFGELCSLAAVAGVLLLEAYATTSASMKRL